MELQGSCGWTSLVLVSSFWSVMWMTSVTVRQWFYFYHLVQGLVILIRKQLADCTFCPFRNTVALMGEVCAGCQIAFKVLYYSGRLWKPAASNKILLKVSTIIQIQSGATTTPHVIKSTAQDRGCCWWARRRRGRARRHLSRTVS